VTVFAGVNGLIDELKVEDIKAWEVGLHDYLKTKAKSVVDELSSKNKIDDDLKAKLQNLLKDYNVKFKEKKELSA